MKNPLTRNYRANNDFNNFLSAWAWSISYLSTNAYQFGALTNIRHECSWCTSVETTENITIASADGHDTRNSVQIREMPTGIRARTLDSERIGTFSCVCMWQCNRMRIYSASTTGVDAETEYRFHPSVRTRTENIRYRHRLYSVHTLATRNCFDGFLSKYRDNVYALYMQMAVYLICSQLKYNWLWKKWVCCNKKNDSSEVIKRLIDTRVRTFLERLPLSLNFCIEKINCRDSDIVYGLVYWKNICLRTFVKIKKLHYRLKTNNIKYEFESRYTSRDYSR